MKLRAPPASTSARPEPRVAHPIQLVVRSIKADDSAFAPQHPAERVVRTGPNRHPSNLRVTLGHSVQSRSVEMLAITEPENSECRVAQRRVALSSVASKTGVEITGRGELITS